MSDKSNAKPPAPRATTPIWVKSVLAVLALLLAAFVLLHLTGHGFGEHGAHMHP